MIKDKGIDKGLVQEFDTTAKKGLGNRFYGFRKMFWDYLNKINVTFYDACCPTANGSTEDLSFSTLRYNETDSVQERFDITTGAWVSTATDNQTVADFTADSVTTDTLTSASTFITVEKGLAKVPGTTTAINVTADPTAANIVGGLITSTSAAAVAMTLPTVASIVAIVGSVRGTIIEFVVDNGLGANTITLTAGTGMTASSALTGGTTLTVASGVVGQFRLYIQSGTTAKLARIA